LVKAADMLIARRADTRARADFATWKMMAKLNGLSALPEDAQGFLAGYKKLLEQTSEAEATEATIAELYKSYYLEMGGAGNPPDVRTRPAEPVADNVTAFRRPAPKADFRLPGRGLCRDQVLLALSARPRGASALSSLPVLSKDHRQDEGQPLIRD
jgi:hypothetical protein